MISASRSLTLLAAMAVSIASGLGFAQATTPPAAAPTSAAPAVPADDPIPSKPGTYRLSVQATADGQTLRIPYVLYVPDNYQPDGKCPVLVFLHGLGERGTDLDAIFIHGPNFELLKPEREDFRHSFPFVLISAQCPPRGQRWDDNIMPKYLHATLDRVLPKIAHDPDRVYLTGFSMGGLATWKVAAVNPSRFAAILPVSAQPFPSAAGAPLKGMSTLAIVGEGDQMAVAGSHAMVDSINAVGGNARLIEGPGGHGIWVACYANPQIYEWLLTQRRHQPAPTTLPAMSANTPANAGFHLRSIPVELLGQTLSMSCQVYIPPSLKPGQKAPAIVFLHDDRTIGIEKDGMLYHGPAAELLRPEVRKDFPFILICPQLPPIIGRWGDPAILAAVEKAVADAASSLPIDEKRLYIVGENMGARGATLLARRKGAYYAAELAIMTHPRVAIGDLRGDWLPKQRIQLVLTEKFDAGRTEQLQDFIKAAAPGSALIVLPSEANHPANPFAAREFSNWLLK